MGYDWKPRKRSHDDGNTKNLYRRIQTRSYQTRDRTGAGPKTGGTRSWYRPTDPALVVARNRRLSSTTPNSPVWAADITYLPTREGWLYLAIVLDLYARRVVGWSIQPTLERTLVLAALADALGRRQPPASVLHHSDRGSQYASGEYQAMLAEHGIEASLSTL